MDIINEIFLNWSQIIDPYVIKVFFAGFIVIVFTLVFTDRFY